MSPLMSVGMQEVSIWHASKQKAPGAGEVQGYSVAPDLTTVTLMIEQLTPGRARRIFGVDSDATYRGKADEGHDIRKEDLLKVTAGKLQGTYVRVNDVIPALGTDMVILELEDAKERPDA